MKNIHRIMGATFMHSKANLCPTCIHRQEYGEWEGYCTVKDKILSAPKERRNKAGEWVTVTGRCSDYENA